MYNVGDIELVIILLTFVTVAASIGLTVWIVNKTTRSVWTPQFGAGPPPSHPDGWYPDPSGRHQERWYRSGRWTPQVRDGGANGPVLDDPI